MPCPTQASDGRHSAFALGLAKPSQVGKWRPNGHGVLRLASDPHSSLLGCARLPLGEDHDALSESRHLRQPEPDAANPHVRFDDRDAETESWTRASQRFEE